MAFIYFDFSYAVKEHDYIIEHSGGLSDIRLIPQQLALRPLGFE